MNIPSEFKELIVLRSAKTIFVLNAKEQEFKYTFGSEICSILVDYINFEEPTLRYFY